MMSEDLFKEVQKSQLRIYEDSAKRNGAIEMQQIIDRQRSLQREEERELRKSQIESMKIMENGEVYTQTKNLRVKAEARRNFNFLFPEIFIFKHMGSEYEQLFLLRFEVERQDYWTVLDPSRCNSGGYVLGKMNNIGGEVFANTLAKRKELARQMVTMCIRNCENQITLPDERGWMKDVDGKISFFNGRWTWKEACKCAM